MDALRSALVLTLVMAVAPRVAAVAPPLTPAPRLDLNGDPLPAGALCRVGSLYLTGGRITAVAFSPDGKLAASAGDDGVLRLWDVGAGRPRFRLLVRNLEGERAPSIDPDSAPSLAFSPDGRHLAATSRGPTARLWDVHTGKEARSFRAPAPLLAVALCPDGRRLAAACADGSALLWCASTGKRLHTLKAHRGKALAVAFDPTGRFLATSGQDGAVVLWEAGTGRRAPLASPRKRARRGRCLLARREVPRHDGERHRHPALVPAHRARAPTPAPEPEQSLLHARRHRAAHDGGPGSVLLAGGAPGRAPPSLRRGVPRRLLLRPLARRPGAGQRGPHYPVAAGVAGPAPEDTRLP